MGDLAKAFAGYAETPYGWVDDSSTSDSSSHVGQPIYGEGLDLSTLDFGSDGTAFLKTMAVAIRLPYKSYYVTQDIFSRKKWHLSAGSFGFFKEIPNARDYIKTMRDENGELGVLIHQDLIDVLENMLLEV